MEETKQQQKGVEMEKAHDILENLLDAGFNYIEIQDALEDGEYLHKMGIDQETAEEVYFLVEKQIKK